MNIRELENAAQIATHTRYEYQRMVDKIRRDRLAEFEKALMAELKAQYGEQDAQFCEAEREANAALEKAKSEAAAAGTDAPYPLGTRFAEWEIPRWKYGPDRKWQTTGRTAVFAAVTSENVNELTRKLGWGSNAKAGDYVLRLLKKDGTPSAVYTRLDKWGPWCPEGQDRNTWQGVPEREQEIAL